MADLEIRCSVCKCYLGVIRDAKLKKGLGYLCSDCKDEIIAPYQNPKSSSAEMPDFFQSIFGGFK